MLGVPSFLGRTIGESDDRAEGAGPVAVASYSWFQRQFNGDPSALGKTIRIQSHDYTLVGVARPGFYGYTVGQSTDLWIPLSMEKAFSRPGWNGLGDKFFQSLYLIGRLKPGVTPPRRAPKPICCSSRFSAATSGLNLRKSTSMILHTPVSN